jgi:Trk K+ transport system NAD-binding subunit
VRAVWRDTRALFKEFRAPILLFLTTIFGGGLLYRELLGTAGYGYPPVIDMPYIILRLMIFEPHLEEAPAQPQLIIFWYVMPLVAFYILGRGTADFMRLFFNRDERRGAWEEAVASTFRNHVIVIGVGHVGLRVVRELVKMGFEVVAVELKGSAELKKEMDALGVGLLIGDGRSAAMLETAGIEYARALIICTTQDSMNMEITLHVRQMNEKIRIVARMWDDRLTRQLERLLGVRAVSASDLAAPVFAGSAVGVDITQKMTIQNVDYSMIRLTVEAGSFLEGEQVGKLQKVHDMDIVLHGRGGSVDVQPDNTTLVQGGDTLVIFARHDNIVNIVERNRHKR